MLQRRARLCSRLQKRVRKADDDMGAGRLRWEATLNNKPAIDSVGRKLIVDTFINGEEL
jgi:hypothetical protein